MKILLLQIDAFADRPFTGNPAAVCLLPKAAPDAWMQTVAAEMNLSETAFLLRREDGFDLRWFTPTVEVALCGHATLASAHALWEEGLLGIDETARFHTKSGLLLASKKGETIEMDFPVKHEEPAPPPEGLEQALGAPPKYIGRNQFDYLVELGSEETVRRLKPDFARLSKLGVRGVIVTSLASPGMNYAVVSRYFAPGSGIDEDPVTGSAHCCLGPYWAPRLGKTEFLAYQASPRGGFVGVRVAGDRVFLIGKAVTIFRGQLDSSGLEAPS